MHKVSHRIKSSIIDFDINTFGGKVKCSMHFEPPSYQACALKFVNIALALQNVMKGNKT